MNKLAIKYFKAFKNEVEIDFDTKNLLVYGENGAGKSSIYEALKIIFFKAKLAESIEVRPTPEDQQQVNIDYWSKYNNRNTNRDFEIFVNDTNYLTFSTVPYQVFMISLYETFFESK